MMTNNSFKSWWLVLLKGIVLIILGFLVITHPVGALLGVTLYIGIALLFTGIILILSSLSARKSMKSWGWMFAAGVLDTLLGIMLLAHPGVTAVVIPFIIGFWVLFYGILLLVDAFGMKKAGLNIWSFQLVTGILTVMIGYLITFNPLAGLITFTLLIGIPILMFGVFNVILAFALKKHGAPA